MDELRLLLMAIRAMKIRVRVPATSANLGPGFDALGLALDLWNEVVFSRPTTRCPRGIATTAAPIEASVSMTPQCTPPWTMPSGW